MTDITTIMARACVHANITTGAADDWPTFAEAVKKFIMDAGFVIVPEEPTEAMEKAGALVLDYYDKWLAGDIWDRMLTASQGGDE